MAHVFHSDNDDFFDAALYSSPPPGLVNYMQNQFSNIANSVGEMGNMFLQRASNMFESINANARFNAAKRELNRAVGYVHHNEVGYLSSVDQIKAANPIMQRWVMAEPTYRADYLNQTADGYSDSYINIHGNVLGADHYDYRRVMDGVLTYNERTEEFFTQSFIEDLIEGDRELTNFERRDILSVWDVMREIHSLVKDDITNPL